MSKDNDALSWIEGDEPKKKKTVPPLGSGETGSHVSPKTKRREPQRTQPPKIEQRPVTAPSPPQLTTFGIAAIGVAYSVLIVSVIAGLVFLSLGFAMSAPQQGAWAATIGSCLVAAYALARSIEKMIRAAHRL